MGSTRDFLFSTLSDSLLPRLKPLLEDVVMEVLGDRQVPTRTDFQELRDLSNTLRGQVSGAATSVTRLRAQLEAAEASVKRLEEERAELLRRVETLERDYLGKRP